MHASNDERQRFGDLLRRARIAAGLTQEELAEQAGLSARGISDLERGARHTPRRETLNLLISALQLTEEESREWRRARTAPDAGTAPSPQPTNLFGREREVDVLNLALEQSLSGNGRVILLAGEPGIGKTRLAEELLATARNRNVLTVWGRCYQGTGAPDYWPWIQLLRALVARFPEADLRRYIGRGAADIAQILPELQDKWPTLPSETLEGETARFRLFESITTFLLAIAEDHPLMVAIDDLQWADHSSLLLLGFVAREVRDNRMLMLGLYRDTEIDRDGALASTILEITRQPANRQLNLQGLQQHDVQAMFNLRVEHDVPADMADQIIERTAGNPFFVAEVIGFLEADSAASMPCFNIEWNLPIPLGVRELIRQRLSRLDTDCRSVLEVAAVVGREFDLRLLQEVSQVPTEDLLDLLESAVQAGIIQSLPGMAISYRFVHDLIRETVYDDLRPSQRIKLHEHVGLALERLHKDDLAPHYGRVAYHYVVAAPLIGHERAIDFLEKAGRQAIAQVAYDNAVEHYGKAVELIGHYGELDSEQGADLLLELSESRRRAGRIPAARETFQRAAKIARRKHLPQHLARAAIGVSGGIVLAGRDDPVAYELLVEASQVLGPEDSAIRAQCLARASLALSREVDPASRSGWIEPSIEAIEVARRVGDPESLAIALHARHREIWSASEGRPEDGITVASEMVDAARESGNPELLFTGLCWRMFEPLAIGDMSTVDRLFAECEHLAAELRQPFYTFMITSLRAMRALLDGRLTEAETLTDQARSVALEVGVPQHYDVFWWWLLKFQIYREKDRFSEVEELIPVMQEGISSFILMNRVVSSQLTLLHATQATEPRQAAIPARDPDLPTEIRATLDEISAVSYYGSKSHTLYSLVHLAEAATISGDTQLAERLYKLIAPDAGLVATVGGSFMCVGSIAHYCGLLSTILSRWDIAERHFRHALAMNEKIGASPFAARTRYAWADMLLNRGQPGDEMRARQLLDDVERDATEMEMVALLRQVMELRNR